ncbi:MAG: DUF4432 family protein [Thermomicrobiales bacterium]
MPHLFGRDFTREELMQRVGRLDQVAGVQLVERTDGAERGVRVLEFRTGSGFEFDVIVDRAMDIGRCEHQGRALGWQSATGFTGPWYFEPEDSGLAAWLRRRPGNHVRHGARALHGRGHGGAPPLSCQVHGELWPARPRFLHTRQAHWVWRTLKDDAILWAEGEVQQAAVFGENFLLRRRVEATVGANHLRLHDEVTNAGWNPTPHMYLYHVNVGFLALDDGAELLIPASNLIPRGSHDVSGYRTFHGPVAGYEEQVTEHDVAAEADGSVPVAIANRVAGFGAYEVFNKTQLPYHFIWRMLGQGAYVVGIEPSTNRTSGRLPARESGELIILQPGVAGRTTSNWVH